jgi:hypothetical protein
MTVTTVTKNQAKAMIKNLKGSIFDGRYSLEGENLFLYKAEEDPEGHIIWPHKKFVAKIADEVINLVVNGKLFPISEVMKGRVALPKGIYSAIDYTGKYYDVNCLYSNGTHVSKDLGYGECDHFFLKHEDHILQSYIPEPTVVDEEYEYEE